MEAIGGRVFFETERLYARQLTQQDVAELAEILSDPEVMRYSVRGVCDEAATRAFVDWCLDCYASHGVGPWALVEKVSGELVGFCGVSPERVAGVVEMNLGYRLAKRFWKRGLATGAVEATLEYAFVQKEILSVAVIIEPEHTVSIRVAEKAGFQQFEVLEFHGRPVRLYRMPVECWRSSARERTRQPKAT